MNQKKEKEGPVRVLHVVGAMYPGGIENFLMNLYAHVDPEKVHFDFAVHARKENDYGDRIEAMGGRLYVLPRLTAHPVKSLRALTGIVREGRYDVVVRHTANALITPQLLAAKAAGAKTVCHAHSTTDPMKALHYVGRLLMRPAADLRMACSEPAGKWMYGSLPFSIADNAIDIRSFAYSAEEEKRIREEFGLGGKHVYGHIGNFVPPKNHPYLLEIFRRIADADPEAVLLLVGDGDLRAEVEAKIKELSLEERVVLTGVRRDVSAFLSAIDVIVFPSIFEGLPLSLIEAQAAGVPMLISEGITTEVIVTKGLVYRESVEKDPGVWAEEARAIFADAGRTPKEEARIQQTEELRRHGYDIEALARWYEEEMRKLAGK